MKKRVTITGASGWLGRSMLEVLVQNGYQGDDIVALGSYARDIQLSNGQVVHIYDLAKPPSSIEETKILVHLAYLTRDKVEQVGYEKYVLENLSLTSLATSWIRNLPLQAFITVSSGARNDQATGLPETNIKTNPYGFLKRIDEELFSAECELRGIPCVISRLWGASGHDIQDPEKYAIGDFIISAINNGRISIQAGHRVVRRYVDSREYMNVLFSLADQGISADFDSGGPEIEIGDLAELIIDELQRDIDVERPQKASREDDLYFPKSHQFEEFASKLNIELSPITRQIHNTVAGIRTLRGI